MRNFSALLGAFVACFAPAMALANTTPASPANDTRCVIDAGFPVLGFYQGGSCWLFGLGIREGNDNNNNGCGDSTTCSSAQVDYWYTIAQQTTTRAANKAQGDCGVHQDPHQVHCIYEIYWNPSIAHSNDLDPVTGGNPPTGSNGNINGGFPIANSNACGAEPNALNGAVDQTTVMALFDYEYPADEPTYYHLTTSTYGNRGYFQVAGDHCNPVSLTITQPIMQSTMPQAVMVNNTTNVLVGSQLHVGGANPEDVSVTAVGTGSITAVFGSDHAINVAATGSAINDANWGTDFFIDQSSTNYEAFANQIFQGICGNAHVGLPTGNGQMYPVMQDCPAAMADARLWMSDRAVTTIKKLTDATGMPPSNTGTGVTSLLEASTSATMIANRNAMFDQGQRLSSVRMGTGAPYAVTVPLFENNGIEPGNKNEFINDNLSDEYDSVNIFSGACENCSRGYSHQPDVEEWSAAINDAITIFTLQGGRGRIRINDYDSGGGSMQERMAHVGMLLMVCGFGPTQCFNRDSWNDDLTQPPINVYAPDLLSIASTPLHPVQVPTNTNATTQGCDGTNANHGANDLRVTDATGTGVTNGVGGDYNGNTVCVLGQEYSKVYFPSTWDHAGCTGTGCRDQEVTALAKVGNGVLAVIMSETNHAITLKCDGTGYLQQSYNQSYQPTQTGNTAATSGDILDLLDGTNHAQPFVTFANVFTTTAFTCGAAGTQIPAGQTWLLGHS